MRSGDFGEGCGQHESTQSLTLLPHKTRSKLSRPGQSEVQHSANAGFEGGQGGPGRPGLGLGRSGMVQCRARSFGG